jgi:hypothetical protein
MLKADPYRSWLDHYREFRFVVRAVPEKGGSQTQIPNLQNTALGHAQILI